MTDTRSAAPGPASPQTVLARFDAPVAVIVILGAPLIGSVASGLILAIAIFGWFRLLGVSRLRLPRPVFWTSVAFVAFFAAEALAGIVNWHGLPTLREIGENFTFLGLLPCYMLLARSPRGPSGLLDVMLKAAPWCAFVALAVALVQAFFVPMRPQGGAGNAAVFAVTVAILLAFTLANAMRRQRDAHLPVAVAGVLAASATLILSDTRSLWPCLAVFPLLTWLATRKTGLAALRPLLLAVAAIVLTGLVFAGTIRDRLGEAAADIEASASGHYQTPLGKRLVVWQVALDAIAERPVLGHGPNSPRDLMSARTAAIAGVPVIYNHFHDFLLNEMVRAGIAGTLAMLAMLAVPLAFAGRRRAGETAALGLGLLLCFQAAFVMSGLAGIMLDHDIMDTQFVAMTALCLYLLHAPDNSVEMTREMAAGPAASAAV